MEFPGFLGNDRLKANLSAAVDRQREAHFYLISGPEGAGKKTLARLLSAALLCRDPARRPCGQCPQCRKAMSGQHPDVITVDDPEKKTVPVRLVRQARDELFIRPNEGRRKILYIPRAQDLSPAGQNALLKVLEEPPEYAVFLLLSDSPSRLLPTVRSRCVLLPLQPLPTGTIAAVLAQEFPRAGEKEIQAAAAGSGGWLGQAKTRLANGSGWLPETQQFAQCFAAKDRLGLLRLLTPLERQKRDTLVPLFTQWQALLHAALLQQSGRPSPDSLCRSLAAGCSGQAISQGIRILESSLACLQGNASTGAVCGNLVWQLW